MKTEITTYTDYLKAKYTTLVLTIADLRQELKGRKILGFSSPEMKQYTNEEINSLINRYVEKAQVIRLDEYFGK